MYIPTLATYTILFLLPPQVALLKAHLTGLLPLLAELSSAVEEAGQRGDREEREREELLRMAAQRLQEQQKQEQQKQQEQQVKQEKSQGAVDQVISGSPISGCRVIGTGIPPSLIPVLAFCYRVPQPSHPLPPPLERLLPLTVGLLRNVSESVL